MPDEDIEFSPEFERAVKQVLSDYHIDPDHSSDLVAAGVTRDDCLAFLQFMATDTPDFVIAAAVAVQWAVAIGIWIERHRWQGIPITDDQE